MQIEVQTEDENGNIVFQGTLSKREVDFCLNVGINFLMANGASPFIRDDEEAIEAPSTNTVQ